MAKRPDLPADFRLQRDSSGNQRVSSSWTAVMAEAIGHLQQIIGIDTSNPPGNDLPIARYLGSVLDAEKIENRVLEIAPNRAAIVAHVRGTGQAPPILIAGHTLTPPVDVDQWSIPPFKGVVRNGCVYGRGAVGNKGMLVANLAAFLCLKRSVLDAGGTLDRDIIFVATADEQAEGDEGMQWLIGNHPDMIRAEYALNDCGRIRMVDGQPLYALVQTAEQVTRAVTISAKDVEGGTTVSLQHSAVFRLARAMVRIRAYRAPSRLPPSTADRVVAMARTWTHSIEADAVDSVRSEEARLAKQAADFLAEHPVFDAALRADDEQPLTDDALFEKSSATLNVRTLPGTHIDDVANQLQRLIDDESIVVSVADALDAPESPMFAAIGAAVAELDPIIAVMPYLSSRESESVRLRALGTRTYGLPPFPIDADDEARARAHDERLSLASFEFGIRVLVGILRRMTLPLS